MKYYSEENNGQGQEKMITKGKLRGYVNWLNETKGGSFLRATASGSNRLVIERMSDISGGTIHWTATRDTQSSQLTASTSASSITITSNYSSRIPRGKFYLVGPDGTQYTELDNSNGGDNYSGFEDMTFIEADEKLDTYCLTYSDLSGGTYARVFDVSTMKDGIVIDGYSISSSGQYKANQLVAEKDVNFGKLEYDLVVESITVEVDAMTDLLEYQRGYVPNTNGDILQYAKVMDVTNGTNKEFKDFELVYQRTTNDSGLTDNVNTSGQTLSGVTIQGAGNIAKAKKNETNRTYELTVNVYQDSGYTLSSTTISTPIGTPKVFSAYTSNHTFTANSTNSGTGKVSIVRIAANGQVTFDIKQRKEIYGYFPVNVYRQGTSDFAIDENGNVELSAADKFVKINMDRKVFTSSTYDFYDTVTIVPWVSGWTDNAGDNFGNNALCNDKVSLSSTEKSVYDDVLTAQGISDMTLCGKDVYNTNGIVYDRGENIGSSVYHVAYANGLYGGTYSQDVNSEGGFDKTRHFFCSGGTFSPDFTSPVCTFRHMSYTSDPFESDYTYDVKYERVYWKDMHSYGMTSILRRFRIIGGDTLDSAKSSYSEIRQIEGFPEPAVSVSETISGNKFPKHIMGKSFKLVLSNRWGAFSNMVLKAGSNLVTGWTTVFEREENVERYGDYSLDYSGNTTVRDLVVNVIGGNYHLQCYKENDSEYYYNNIHPLFYAVDPERCVGKSSGYTFYTPNTITDTTYGRSSVRNYFWDDEHYFLTKGLCCIQAPKEDMITYINLDSNNNLLFDSTRYGSTEVNGYVYSSCNPSAPTQKISWMDSYAPYSGDNPSYIVEKDGIAFVGEKDGVNKQYIGNGSPTLNKFLVPSVTNWRSFDYNITLSDVNNFGSENLYHSFAGQTSYASLTGSSTSNVSSHHFAESVNYMVRNHDYCLDYSSTYGDMLGYKVDTSVYNFVGDEPKNMVNSLSGFTNDGTYSSSTYIYLSTENATEFSFNDAHTLDEDRPYKSLPLKVKNTLYGQTITNNQIIYDALRPCSGYTTIPYWYTEIRFTARFARELESEEVFDPINDYGLTLSVQDKVFSTTSTSFPVSSLSNINIVSDVTNTVSFRLLSSDTQSVYLSDTSDTTMNNPEKNVHTTPGIRAYFDYDGESQTVSGQTYRIIKLTLLFIDVYGMFDVKVTCGKNDMANQVLSWEIDGKNKLKIGAEVFARLGYHYWGDYEDNTSQTSGNSLACIGIEGDLIIPDMANKRTVTGLMYNYGLMNNGLPFNEMTYDNNYATHSEEISDGTWW